MAVAAADLLTLYSLTAAYVEELSYVGLVCGWRLKVSALVDKLPEPGKVHSVMAAVPLPGPTSSLLYRRVCSIHACRGCIVCCSAHSQGWYAAAPV